MKKKLLCLFLLLSIFTSNSQNTVGTTFITEDVYDAFTLISVNTKAYLINNCGEVINEWTSAYIPGNAVYLLPNGNLLRAGRVQDNSSDIVFGGQGGIVELFDWDGNLIWSFLYNSNQERQHHDVFPMPNGNILVLAATVISSADAIAAGRDPNTLPENRLYNEQIIEVEPLENNQFNIAWEWNVKDHLIQDFDNTKDNSGDVSMNPGKLDINFLNGGSGAANWLHFNSIQYDETLDQIVISSRNLSEIYIIDHSTTTPQAATSSGGTYGKGGDFLYRWGNPQSYRQGSEADRVLYGQHYPHYISQGLNDEGKLILFNNGRDRIPSFSEVMIIDPPATIPGFYDYTPDTAFGPTNADYIYEDQSASPSPFYSSIVSSAQRLPNGNTLICEGQFGEIFEIDSNDNKVWEYINPVHNLNGNISSQGNPPPGANILFRAIKYALDFPAFIGRDLTPGMPIEINPDISSCLLALSNENFDLSTSIYPIPTQDFINIESTISIDKIEIYTITGSKIIERRNSDKVDLRTLEKGVYFVKLHSKGNTMSQKIIKQ